jgi:hypothetical protein
MIEYGMQRIQSSNRTIFDFKKKELNRFLEYQYLINKDLIIIAIVNKQNDYLLQKWSRVKLNNLILE